jgi:cytochrome b6-f complex iron-sulfur subunit
LQQVEQLRGSVHNPELRCQDCHGGPAGYDLSAQQIAEFAALFSQPGDAWRQRTFDHGSSFRGKAARKEVPARCGTCHADVARMNPYGLRTDQLASYWVSGHGKRLQQYDDDRVAVCVDCHGSHDVLRHDNPQSRTYFQNVPQTCGRCHADRALMAQYDLSPDIVDQYTKSVHGRNVLEHGDAGSPNCATCHGSHAAAPPGFTEVGHVCGKCHQQIEQYFAAGIHGRIPLIRRCVGCHAKNGARGNHDIGEASPPAEELVRVFERVRGESGRDESKARAQFTAQVDTLPDALRLDVACRNCHGVTRLDPHAQFIESNDRIAMDKGVELADALRRAQFEYARLAERVERLGRGVLLVKDEALQTEEARTKLLALNAFLHTLEATEVHARVRELKDLCSDVHAALHVKELSLTRRRQTVVLGWALIGLFCTLMYRKYRLLRAAYVRAPGADAAAAAGAAAGATRHAMPTSARSAALPTLGRRRFLDRALGTLGGVGVLALLWPALAYVFPARKRGGAAEQVSAGKQEGWAVWEIRKVAFGGKAVGVIRTGDGFRAFSLVCTHLGCIVGWNSGKREFECPCHAARFDAEGRVVAGPPPKPLPQYGVSVVQGEVIVTSAAG